LKMGPPPAVHKTRTKKKLDESVKYQKDATRPRQKGRGKGNGGKKKGKKKGTTARETGGNTWSRKDDELGARGKFLARSDRL